jgi:hypothetical protein
MKILLPATLDDAAEESWTVDEKELALACYGIGNKLKISLLSFVKG